MNIPLNLLFAPLVYDEVKQVDFQLFLCRSRPRLVDFRGAIAQRTQRGFARVTYSPNVGLLSVVARAFVPRLVFWFDPTASNPWIGHRLPLYSSGPEIVVLRDGIAYEHLEVDD